MGYNNAQIESLCKDGVVIWAPEAFNNTRPGPVCILLIASANPSSERRSRGASPPLLPIKSIRLSFRADTSCFKNFRKRLSLLFNRRRKLDGRAGDDLRAEIKESRPGLG